jgi:hypothetical protein
MLNEGLKQLDVPTVQQKAVRDAAGNVMQPRRHPDIVAVDDAGLGHPIDLTTPGQLNSPQKQMQKARDAQHAQTSPQRGVKDDNGQFIPFGSDVVHTGGYAIMPDTSGLKN